MTDSVSSLAGSVLQATILPDEDWATLQPFVEKAQSLAGSILSLWPQLLQLRQEVTTRCTALNSEKANLLPVAPRSAQARNRIADIEAELSRLAGWLTLLPPAEG